MQFILCICRQYKFQMKRITHYILLLAMTSLFESNQFTFPFKLTALYQCGPVKRHISDVSHHQAKCNTCSVCHDCSVGFNLAALGVDLALLVARPAISAAQTLSYTFVAHYVVALPSLWPNPLINKAN